MSASVLQVSDLPGLRLTDAHTPSAGTKDTAAPSGPVPALLAAFL